MKYMIVILSCFLFAACSKDCKWDYVTDKTKQEQIFFYCVNMLPNGSHHDIGEAIKQCRETSYDLSTESIWSCNE